MNYILEPLPYKKAKRLYQCFDTDKIIKDSKAFYGVIEEDNGYKVVKDAIQSEYNLGYLFGFDSASKGVDIEDLDLGQNTAEYKNGVFKAYRDILSKEDLTEPAEQELDEEESPEVEEPELEEENEGLEDSYIPELTHRRLQDTAFGDTLTFVTKPKSPRKGQEIYKIKDSNLYAIVDAAEFIQSENGPLQFLQNQGIVDLYISNDGEIVEVPHTETESEDVKVEGRDVPLYELRKKFSKNFLIDHPPYSTMKTALWNQAIDQFNGRALLPIAVMKRYNELKKNGRDN